MGNVPCNLKPLVKRCISLHFTSLLWDNLARGRSQRSHHPAWPCSIRRFLLPAIQIHLGLGSSTCRWTSMSTTCQQSFRGSRRPLSHRPSSSSNTQTFFPKALRRVLPENPLNTYTSTLTLTYTHTGRAKASKCEVCQCQSMQV